MEGVIFGLFAVSFILLMGMFYNIRTIFKPGISMSTNLLKKKATVLGVAGFLFLLMAIMLLNF